MIIQMHSGSTRGKALLDIVVNLIKVVESVFFKNPMFQITVYLYVNIQNDNSNLNISQGY